MMSDVFNLDTAFCPRYHFAVELIGKRWNGAIVRALLGGHERFADIRQAVPDLSDTMLAERLKELESEGIVQRTVEPTTPVRITYTLTRKGRALHAVVEAISDWADEWVPANSGGQKRNLAGKRKAAALGSAARRRRARAA